MTPTPPVGQGPITDIYNQNVADEITRKSSVYQRELEYYHKVVAYLTFMANYKTNAETRIAYGMPPDPLPTPPAGYVLPEPAPVIKPPAPTTVVREAVADVQYGVIYPAPGDPNSDGTMIDNPFRSDDSMLVKVVHSTPFGKAHFWIDAASQHA